MFFLPHALRAVTPKIEKSEENGSSRAFDQSSEAPLFLFVVLLPLFLLVFSPLPLGLYHAMSLAGLSGKE